MRQTLSAEKKAKLAQYERDVAAWVAEHGSIPLVPVQRAKVERRTIRQLDRERLQRACPGVRV